MFPVEKTSVRADSNIVEKRELERVESSDRAHFSVYSREQWAKWSCLPVVFYSISETDKPDTDRHSLMDSAQKTKFRYPAQMAHWNRKWMGCVDRDKKRLPEEDNSSKEVIRRPLIWRLCVRNLIQASPLIPFKRTISCGLRIVCIRRKEIFRSRPEICRMIYNRTVRVKKRLYLL